jgi:hypothetical protein
MREHVSYEQDMGGERERSCESGMRYSGCGLIGSGEGNWIGSIYRDSSQPECKTERTETEILAGVA